MIFKRSPRPVSRRSTDVVSATSKSTESPRLVPPGFALFLWGFWIERQRVFSFPRTPPSLSLELKGCRSCHWFNRRLPQGAVRSDEPSFKEGDATRARFGWFVRPPSSIQDQGRISGGQRIETGSLPLRAIKDGSLVVKRSRNALLTTGRGAAYGVWSFSDLGEHGVWHVAFLGRTPCPFYKRSLRGMQGMRRCFLVLPIKNSFRKNSKSIEIYLCISCISCTPLVRLAA